LSLTSPTRILAKDKTNVTSLQMKIETITN
jgi:hypothetical protein